MTAPAYPPLTRARAAMLLDYIRMSAAEIAAYKVQTDRLVSRIDAASAELYAGVCKEMPPEIEIQPRLVKSA